MNSLSSDYQTFFLDKPAAEPESISYNFESANASVTGRYLEWDTEVIGVPSGRIDLLWCKSKEFITELDSLFSDCIRAMKSDGIKFIDLRIGLHVLPMVQLAEKHGFFLTDILNIYLSQSPPEPIQIPADYSIRLGRPQELHDRESIFEIAKNLFSHSRMYQDMNIHEQTADEFYSKLVNHFMFKDDTLFAVAYAESRPAAFYIGMQDSGNPSVSKSLGYLWLIGVSPEHSGKGLGNFLLNHFLINMHKTCDLVEIGTQVNNLPANKIYNRAGLPLKANLASLHYWAK